MRCFSGFGFFGTPCTENCDFKSIFISIIMNITHKSIFISFERVLRLHSSYAFFIRAYTRVKVEFALHPTYEITKFIKGQHSVLCMI